MSGTRPINVVSEVKKIGLKRMAPAFDTDSTIPMPSSRRRLMETTSTRLAFTTTPLKAIMPSTEKKTKSAPIMKCPNTAPIAPKGITLIMISGWK